MRPIPVRGRSVSTASPAQEKCKPRSAFDSSRQISNADSGLPFLRAPLQSLDATQAALERDGLARLAPADAACAVMLVKPGGGHHYAATPITQRRLRWRRSRWRKTEIFSTSTTSAFK